MRRPAKSVVVASTVIAAFALFGSSEAGVLASASPAHAHATTISAAAPATTSTTPPADPNSGGGNDPWD